MTAITELARAKVNLTLRVRGRGPDGYHELESLIVFAGVGDELHLEQSGAAGVDVTGPFAAAIAGANLVETAMARLAAAEPRLALGRVTLDKRLPVASGIGGGSADAAALLRAVRRANPALAGSVDWAGIAARLGADVPICFRNEPGLVWGVGERIEAIPVLPQLPAVLVNPLVPVPPDKTARVFARLAAAPSAARPHPPEVAPGRLASVETLLGFLRDEGNDLLAAATATVPTIGDVLAALAQVPGCRFAGLSGAGPTCFGLFATAGEAAGAAATLREKRPDWWIVATTLGH
jgi:4-diphosphocytidyl-2-C-methyl-D-erythritol kinase